MSKNNKTEKDKGGESQGEIIKRIKESAIGGFIIERWGRLTAIIPGRKVAPGGLTPEQLEILKLFEGLSAEERKKIIALIKSEIETG